MRHVWIPLFGASMLLLAGCAPQPGTPSGTTGQQQSQTAVSFDDLLTVSRLEMITKASSDLPKNWIWQGQEAKDRAAKVVPVLKSATKLDIKEPVKAPAMLTLIGDTPSGKRIINIFNDRIEYSGTWYQLDGAPDKTYEPIKPE
ncbi:hypothetical protein [Tumebacillus permanentifrigoris]|uniref:Lipoprotein n=1 Tax=Tumebacillus permanentifrigoris TaxID=378543 RepID=A0A316D9X0_9BACL|nr:hypothetical protein [Tumebacillus permanentifrigoris]PWK12731.1 hypothetical protein C7459_10983 [Tumebacillus permanentifrigoris]